MKYLTLLFLLGMAGEVEAVEMWEYNPELEKLRIAHDKIAKDKSLGISTPTVIIGSMTWNLTEFVSSGEMCLRTGGHIWIDPQTYVPVFIRVSKRWDDTNDSACQYEMFCIICHKCRQKIWKERRELEWED